eukprot:403373024
MNITRYNFRQQLPGILKNLQEADFIAIDFEFSGLLQNQQNANQASDTIAQRYWKNKESVRKFMPIQMGICAFKYTHDSKKTLTCFPYNLNIMPSSLRDEKTVLSEGDGSLGTGVQVSNQHNFYVEQTAYQFLQQYKYDFNKLFYESVGYLSYQDYQQYLDDIKLKQYQLALEEQQFDSPECTTYSNSHFLNLQTCLETVGRLIPKEDLETDPRNELKLDITFAKFQLFHSLLRNIPKMFPKDKLDYELIVDDQQGDMYIKVKVTTDEILRKSIKPFTSNQQEFKEILEIITNEEKYEIILKNPQDFQIESLDKVVQKVFDSIKSVAENSLGASIIPLFIAALQKPLIFQNGMLDLLHLYDKFYQSLPDDILEFRSNVSVLYPHIYDNKTLMNNFSDIEATMRNNNGMNLSATYTRAMKDDYKFMQTVQIAPEFSEYNLNLDESHEAGFDALQTGVTFFKLATYLNGKTSQSYDFPKIEELIQEFSSKEESIVNYKNKIPIYNQKKHFNLHPIKSQLQSNYSTTSSSQTQNSNNVQNDYMFVIQNLPIDIDILDLQQKLQTYLGIDTSIYGDEDRVNRLQILKTSQTNANLALQHQNLEAQQDNLQLNNSENTREVHFTVFGKQAEEKLNQMLKEQVAINLDSISMGSKIIGYSQKCKNCLEEAERNIKQIFEHIEKHIGMT